MNTLHITTKEQELIMAHHPQTLSMAEGCRLYCSEKLSVLSFDDSEESQSPPFLHSHEAYEFLIPYGPLPLIMYEKDIYFGDVGFVYPVQSSVVHGSKFNVSGIPHDNVAVDREFMEEILHAKGMAGEKFNLRFALTEEMKAYLHFFKEEYAKRETLWGREHSEGGREKAVISAGINSASEATGSNKKLRALAELLVHEFIESEFSQDHERPKRPQEYQKGIMQIASYMNRHFTEPVSIDTLADMCQLSKPYFISVFKKVMGETPYSYLNLLRMAKAKILLEAGEYSINEISTMCGFTKSNTFTSMFKSSVGMTPTQYKSRHRHDDAGRL